MTPPSPSARRRFAWLLLGLVALYGLWAIWLSARVIDAQYTVRNNLTLALESLHRLEGLSEVTAPNTPAAQAVLHTWQDTRALRLQDPQEAQRLAAALIHEWNLAGVSPDCGAKGPGFILGQSTNAATRACHVYLQVDGAVLHVTGYDTQGAAMDNFYEGLYPYLMHPEAELVPNAPVQPIVVQPSKATRSVEKH